MRMEWDAWSQWLRARGERKTEDSAEGEASEQLALTEAFKETYY